MNQKHLYTSDQKLKWWGYGEWVEEPDEVLFEYEDIKCEIIRIVAPDGPPMVDGTYWMFGGYLCGYICIPKDHPYFAINYSEIEIDVHGGLTFGRFEGEDYWIGFDCAHSEDYVPSMEYFKKLQNYEIFPVPEEFKKYSIFNPVYKNISYCIQECISMVDQLKLVNSKLIGNK